MGMVPIVGGLHPSWNWKVRNELKSSLKGFDLDWTTLYSNQHLIPRILTRATFEGTLKATFADYFSYEKEGAFANIILQNGLSGAIGYVRKWTLCLFWAICIVAPLLLTVDISTLLGMVVVL